MTSISKELNIFKEETLHALQMPRTATAFTNTLQRIVNDLGFSHFDITQVGSNLDLDIMLSTLPQPMLATYITEQLDKYDLSSEYINASLSPVFYSDFFHHFSTSPVLVEKIRKNLLIHELMKNYGFHDAYCCPIQKNNSDNKFIFSIHSEDEKSDEFKQLTMNRRAKIASLSGVVCNLLSESSFLHSTDMAKKNNAVKLSRKQIAILEAMGKYSMTQQQAADYVGLSESTVKSYCKLIKNKLGKKTLNGAIFEALRLGIIATE